MISAKFNEMECYIAGYSKITESTKTKKIQLTLLLPFVKDKEAIANNLNASLQIQNKKIKVKTLKMSTIDDTNPCSPIELYVKVNEKDLVECGVILNE